VKVQCELCPKMCLIQPGQSGECRVRINIDGVLRTVDGTEGSVQLWIENAVRGDTVEQMGLERNGPGLFGAQRQLMHVFDVIIFNIDRNDRNELYTLTDQKLHLIDHSRAFRTPHEVVPPSLPEPRPVSSETAARLRRLDRHELDRLIGDLLTPRQLEAVAVRRDALLVVLDAHGLLPDAD